MNEAVEGRVAAEGRDLGANEGPRDLGDLGDLGDIGDLGANEGSRRISEVSRKYLGRDLGRDLGANEGSRWRRYLRNFVAHDGDASPMDRQSLDR
jgi:hypothetical protein